MTDVDSPDNLLIDRIRRGDQTAWNDLIACYEGRLLAFCNARLGSRATSEDVVQETFIGFLTSLPNYDERRPLESYLFTICAHKLTDYLRREGRRPMLSYSTDSNSSEAESRIPGRLRAASTLIRSAERRELEERAITEVLREQIDRWKSRGDWVKLMCIELLFVRGRANKEVALELGISEQQVANFKFDVLAQLRKSLQRLGLPMDVFPELSAE